jgi:hypothetical protein
MSSSTANDVELLATGGSESTSFAPAPALIDSSQSATPRGPDAPADPTATHSAQDCRIRRKACVRLTNVSNTKASVAVSAQSRYAMLAIEMLVVT